MATRGEREDTPGAEPETGREDRFHRRGFFTEGFRRLLDPLADIVGEGLERVGVPIEDDSDPYPYYAAPPGTKPGTPGGGRPLLRPPGALPEEKFLSTCLSSGRCVSACPVSAIRLNWSGDPLRDGKPAIDPQIRACVLCDDLACMQACPSGALVPVPRAQVRIGLAVVEEERCLRSLGEDCQICADKCPVGSAALAVAPGGGPVEVYPEGCTGCGVCEMYCPAEPRAIIVEPPRREVSGGEGEGIGDGGYLPLE